MVGFFKIDGRADKRWELVIRGGAVGFGLVPQAVGDRPRNLPARELVHHIQAQQDRYERHHEGGAHDRPREKIRQADEGAVLDQRSRHEPSPRSRQADGVPRPAGLRGMLA